MTAALDFAALPPEINSARMYTGAGSGPMLAAASAWNGVAAELRATALSYSSVLAELTSEQWCGPASASMVAAAVPYVTWLSLTAVQAEQAAAQAEAAAGAYEAAFAATVPPMLVEANRIQLRALMVTNILGQNTPAIAAAEAQYSEMWALDAAAMYGYASSSAAATEFTPFVEPNQTTNPSGLAAQATAVTHAAANSAASQYGTLSELISAIPNALQGLSGSSIWQDLEELAEMLMGGGPTWWQDFWNAWGPNANIWNTITSMGMFNPGATVGTLSSLFGAGAAGSVAEDVAAAVPAAANSVAGSVGASGGLGGMISAGMANAGIVGKLAVPPAWTAAAPISSVGSALGGTPMIAPPPAMAAGMPAVPMGNLAGQPFGRALPQYGFRPSFVARPPAAG